MKIYAELARGFMAIFCENWESESLSGWFKRESWRSLVGQSENITENDEIWLFYT